MSTLAPFGCAFCPQTLENFSGYSEHVQAAHPGRGAYFCCLCRTAVATLAELEIHEGRPGHGVPKTLADRLAQVTEAVGPEAGCLAASERFDFGGSILPRRAVP